MQKRVKKLNLNTSNKGHNKLLLKNLVTSLMMYGKVVTTKPRANAVKAEAQSLLSQYSKLQDSRETKRWFKENFSTVKYLPRIQKLFAEKVQLLAVSIVQDAPRKGDAAKQYEVSLLNYDKKKDE